MEAALLQHGLPGIVILALGVAIIVMWRDGKAKDKRHEKQTEELHARNRADLTDANKGLTESNRAMREVNKALLDRMSGTKVPRSSEPPSARG